MRKLIKKTVQVQRWSPASGRLWRLNSLDIKKIGSPAKTNCLPVAEVCFGREFSGIQIQTLNLSIAAPVFDLKS